MGLDWMGLESMGLGWVLLMGKLRDLNHLVNFQINYNSPRLEQSWECYRESSKGLGRLEWLAGSDLVRIDGVTWKWVSPESSYYISMIL